MRVLLPEDCPRCGCWLTLITEAAQPDDGWRAADGDAVACDSCGLGAEISADEDGAAVALPEEWL